MIDYRDLKLGNEILENGVQTHVDIDILEWMQNNPAFANDVIKPINLTEEILLKLGFEKTLLGYRKGKFQARWITNKTMTGGDKLENPFLRIDKFSCDIRYVNHLQNLFYDLTGKQLDFE